MMAPYLLNVVLIQWTRAGGGNPRHVYGKDEKAMCQVRDIALKNRSMLTCAKLVKLL